MRKTGMRTIKDGDVISIIRKFLVSGIMVDGEYEDSVIGKKVKDKSTVFQLVPFHRNKAVKEKNHDKKISS